MTDNPFTLLTLIAGPAVLTNAASVLALNAGNRYGRAFDHAKEVGRELERVPPSSSDEADVLLGVLERLLARAALILRAQSAFHLAIGFFVLSALVSLVAAALSSARPALNPELIALGLAVGVVATACLVHGSMLTLRETRLALVNLREEQVLLRKRSAPPLTRVPRAST